MDVREMTPEGRAALNALQLFYPREPESVLMPKAVAKALKRKLDPDREALDELIITLKQICIREGVMTATELNELYPAIGHNFELEYNEFVKEVAGEPFNFTVKQALDNYYSALIKFRPPLRHRLRQRWALHEQRSLAATEGARTGSLAERLLNRLLR